MDASTVLWKNIEPNKLRSCFQREKNMATQQLLELIRQGTNAWNTWRQQNPSEEPDLHEEDLSNSNLSGANLSRVNLSGATISGANLSKANLSWSIMIGADLRKADVSETTSCMNPPGLLRRSRTNVFAP